MRHVTIPRTNLTVSRFSFGTASLHHVGTARKQQAHLEAAADAGFSHFDTAPLYGYGAAERAIGSAFSASSPITIATKVGLYPPGGSEQRRLAMLSRKVAGRAIPRLSRAAVDWRVARARESLECSLRRLRRDWIDLLLLHEPPVEVTASDEWARWVEGLSEKVGAFGLAGPKRVVLPFLASETPLSQVIQTQDGLQSRDADFVTAAGRELQFTYGYLAGNQRPISPAHVLRGALQRNSTGSVIVSTRRRPRLQELAKLAS